MHRLFFALWPDATVRASVARWAATQDLARARRTPPANFHLTLRFLGPVDADVRRRLLRWQAPTDIGPFDIVLDRPGWWRRSRVAWLGPRSVPGSLQCLHAALSVLDVGPGPIAGYGDFRPHVTLARQVDDEPVFGETPSLTWQVTDFVLVESHPGPRGPRYEIASRWSLSPPAAH